MVRVIEAVHVLVPRVRLEVGVRDHQHRQLGGQSATHLNHQSQEAGEHPHVDDQALEAGQARQSFVFPFLGWAYALIFSMVAFDLIMSLSPWWFSNMFGGWTFVSSVWVALAVIGITSMLGLDWLGLRDYVCLLYTSPSPRD